MEIPPVDKMVRIEPTVHDQREQPQKRQQQRKKPNVPSGLVYTPNGKLEEEPPPKIDVLV